MRITCHSNAISKVVIACFNDLDAHRSVTDIPRMGVVCLNYGMHSLTAVNYLWIFSRIGNADPTAEMIWSQTTVIPLFKQTNSVFLDSINAARMFLLI